MTPSGTIVILSGDLGRYPQFWEDTLNLKYPEGCVTKVIYPGCGIAMARNRALREAEGEWVWFLDDDHQVPADLLNNLLEHNVDVVSPLYLTRRKPFGPVMAGAQFHGTSKRPFYRLTKGLSGLMAVEAVGTAGMLIRRRVWENIDPPWFTIGQPEDGGKDGFAEDLSFCRRVRGAGFDVYCDLDHPFGHRLNAVVTPHKYEDGSWGTKVSLGGVEFMIPPA